MNALSSMGGAPPAPNPQPDSGGNALASQGPSGGAQAAPPPPPTHQQTVAALRHFSAIEGELTHILSDPDVGTADMKSKIIDGTTKLVASGILTPASAVGELGTVPDRPFDQKIWLMKHFQQTVQAQSLVLAHHQIGGPTAPNDEPYNPDNHHSIMAGLMGQYRGGNA